MNIFKSIKFMAVLLAVSSSIHAQDGPRKISDFDKGWRFVLQDASGAQSMKFNDGGWRKLDLPHDWSIEGENLESNSSGNVGYFPMGIGWYRKTFDVPGYDTNCLYSVEFDGVYMNSTVWINGHCLGTWPYGYSSFSYDLTPYLKSSGNVIAVKVDNSGQVNSRWYTGSGIYRHVRLVQTAKTHFEKWGVFNYTKDLRKGKATIAVESTVLNESNRFLRAIIRQVIIDASGKEVASTECAVDILSGADTPVFQTLTVIDPEPWDLDHPYLYTLRSVLLENGKELDRVDNTLGIRMIEYDVDKGFFLNGKHVKMNGVNLHHDGGAMGAAVPERVWERRLEILKSGGCNAIRTAHNPPAPEFLDICDKLGLLVMDEAFDQWITPKNNNDYHLYFDQWHEKDLKAMVARDRNHPSVVMWSIGNEIKDQYTADGPRIARDLIAICHRLDPTRLVTSGNDEIASNTPASPAFLSAFENDIVGYNYPDRWRERKELMYAIDKANFPNRRVVGTETGGYGGARGVYFIPDFVPENATEEPSDQSRRQTFRGRRGGLVSSSLIDVERRWVFNKAYDYVIGDFMWTGIDYYGETRWPSRGASSGYLDNCGFKKDGYWFFKSLWSDDPVLHLLPHWNWRGNEGKIMQVVCFTNMEEVELFVNGKSYGKKATEYPRRGVDISWNQPAPGKHYATTADLHLTWDVEYQPGEIKVVGIRNGNTYEEVIRTAGSPTQLRATVDRPSFKATPSDVAHITVEVLDADGNLCPLADNLVRFKVSGARLVGVENGNMSDLESVKSLQCKAFSGMCLGIVAADKPGSVTVEVMSDGLESSIITFTAK